MSGFANCQTGASCWPAAGDETKHLMWRLANGELPKVKQPRVALVLVGMNDLASVNAAYPNDGETPLLNEVDPLISRCTAVLCCCAVQACKAQYARAKLPPLACRCKLSTTRCGLHTLQERLPAAVG